MTRLVIALALLVTGCGLQNPSETFQVDSRFSPEQRAELQQAADEVCARTEGRFCPLLLNSNQTNKIRCVDELPETKGDVLALGKTDISRGINDATTTIYLVDVKKIGDFSKSTKHEFGHAGGCLRHFPEHWHIMNGEIDFEPDDYTERDIACIDGDYDD